MKIHNFKHYKIIFIFIFFFGYNTVQLSAKKVYRTSKNYLTTMASNSLILSPTRNVLNVATNSNIVITFPQNINNSTLNSSSFRVIGEKAGDITGSFNTVNNVVNFNPTNDFLSGEIVTVILTQNILSTSATSLDKPVIYQFTVQSSSAPATFVEQGGIDNTVTNSYAAYLSDLDKDQNIDVVSASPSAGIKWNKNNSSGIFGVPNAVSGSLNAGKGSMVDLNGDGNTDILFINGAAAKVIWFAGDGMGGFGSEQVVVNESTATSEGAYASDLDGDGDLDVVASFDNLGNDKIDWFENDGTGIFSLGGNIISYTSNESPGTNKSADIDNDGDMDIITELEIADRIVWFANDGLGNFGTEQVISTSTIDRVRDIHIADLNEDGNLDVISASESDDKVIWYQNDGAGNFIEHTAINTMADGAWNISTADFDGDGDLDIVSVSYFDDKIAWYENDGTGSFGTEQIISLNQDAPRFTDTGDIDGDGDIDILVASALDNTVNWYKNATPATALSFDGNNDFVEISDNANLNFGNSTDFTIETWIKYTGSATDYTGIIAKAEDDSAIPFWAGYQLVLVDNKIAAEIADGNTSIGVAEGIQGTSNLNDGNWHHVAMVVTRSSNNIKLYVDGVKEVDIDNALIGNNIDNTSNMYLGVDRNTTNYFSGTIDEARIWNIARSCNEINAGLNCESSGTESGLVVYYSFNQGELNGTNTGITTLRDASSNGINGTLNNLALSGTSSNWISGNPMISGTCNFTIYPEIAILGNTVEIISGDNTPEINDDTDFGSVITPKTVPYTIENQGSGDLNITSITSNNPLFIVSNIPNIVSAGNSVIFYVTFTPTTPITNTAIITIESDDCDEGIYTFTVQGNSPIAESGNMLSLDGDGDYIEIADNNDLDFSAKSFTIDFWVKANGGSGTETLISKRNGATGYELLYDGTSLSFNVDDGAGNDANVSGIFTLPSAWTHIAVSYNIGTGASKIFVNGTQLVTTTGSAGLNVSNSLNVKIGANQSNLNEFKGNIEELRMWETALSEDDIRKSLHLKLTGTEIDLVAYYQFDENSGSIAMDIANSYDAILEGNAIQVVSEVPISEGFSKIVNLGATGNSSVEVDLTTTNLAIDFTDGGTSPNGDLVIFYLSGSPNTSPTGINTTSSKYWIVRNFGTNTTGLSIDKITFRLPNGDEIDESEALTNFKILKRESIDILATDWAEPTNMSCTARNNTSKEVEFTNSGGSDFTSFSQLIVGNTGNSALPITLLSFDAKRNNEKEVLLTWVTTLEKNNKGFEIEMSIDGENFQKVGFVQGQGNSSEVTSYQFTTEQPSSAYYRLKQIDFDGGFEYSELRFVEETENLTKLNIIPNPTKGKVLLSLGLESSENEIFTLKLKDGLGKTILNSEGNLLEINQSLNDILEKLDSGFYFLIIVSDEQHFIKRLIKN